MFSRFSLNRKKKKKRHVNLAPLVNVPNSFVPAAAAVGGAPKRNAAAAAPPAAAKGGAYLRSIHQIRLLPAEGSPRRPVPAAAHFARRPRNIPSPLLIKAGRRAKWPLVRATIKRAAAAAAAAPPDKCKSRPCQHTSKSSCRRGCTLSCRSQKVALRKVLARQQDERH